MHQAAAESQAGPGPNRAPCARDAELAVTLCASDTTTCHGDHTRGQASQVLRGPDVQWPGRAAQGGAGAGPRQQHAVQPSLVVGGCPRLAGILGWVLGVQRAGCQHGLRVGGGSLHSAAWGCLWGGCQLRAGGWEGVLACRQPAVWAGPACRGRPAKDLGWHS